MPSRRSAIAELVEKALELGDATGRSHEVVLIVAKLMKDNKIDDDEVHNKVRDLDERYTKAPIPRREKV